MRYETSWLSGWGLQLLLRPLESTLVSPSRFAIFGRFERYTYESTRIINNLFRDSEGAISAVSLVLPSVLTRWTGGFRYTFPIRAIQRTHQIGLIAAYHGTLMDIQNNTDFLGLDMHQAEIGLLGDFVITPSRFYLILSGGFRPIVSLGNRESEFGATSDNYGISSRIEFLYRGLDGLALGFYLNLDFVFIDTNGEGRDGRIGNLAKDQTISIGLALGFCSSPTP